MGDSEDETSITTLHLASKNEVAGTMLKSERVEARFREYEEALQLCYRKMRIMETRIIELQGSTCACDRCSGIETKVTIHRKDEFSRSIEHISRQDAEDKSTHRQSAAEDDQAITSEVETKIGPSTSSKLYKGSAVTFLGKLFVTPSGSNQVYVFTSNILLWTQLPSCPQSYFSLAVVNGLLTAVGGECPTHYPTNTLVSLMSAGTTQDCTEWQSHFPAMPTRRSFPSVVTHDIFLFVAGGGTSWVQGCSNLVTVELFNSCTMQWFAASSLPSPVRGASAVVCQGSVFLLGGWNDPGNTAFMCSVDSLVSSSVEIRQHSRNYSTDVVITTLSYPPCIWRSIDIPVTQSTCVSVRDRVVTFGGKGLYGSPVSKIYEYDCDGDLWRPIGNLEIPRYHAVAGEIESGRIVVVGGLLKGGHGTDTVEFVSWTDK